METCNYTLKDHIPEKYHFILKDDWKTNEVDFSDPINLEMFKDSAKNQFLFAAAFLSIRDKNQNIVPLRANEAQIRYHLIRQELKKKQKEDGALLARFIILKARQQGISTWEAACNFTATLTRQNIEAAHISHEADTTANFLAMDKRFHENLPKELQCKDFLFSMGKHLVFQDNNSRIKCMTAGNTNTGVGTTTSRLHASEVALWDHGDTLMGGLLPAIPKNTNSIVVAESTAREMSGWYYDTWVGAYEKLGTPDWNGWTPVFLAWHTFSEYRTPLTPKQADYIKNTLQKKEREFIKFHADEFEDEHEIYERLAWRRMTKKSDCKNSDVLFDREYPDRPEVAFMAAGGVYFDAEMVNEKFKLAERINDKGLIIRGKLGQIIPDANYSTETEKLKAYKTGTFYRDKEKLFGFKEDDQGDLYIYKKPSSTHINRYVISVDTAKGINADKINKNDPDYSVAFVHDRLTNVDVAMYQGRIEEHEFAKFLNALGYYYMNDDYTPAKIIIESNQNATLLFLQKVHEYPNLFFKEETDGNDISFKTIKKYGFETTSVTRPIVLGKLRESIKNGKINNPFIQFWKECKSFIVNENGKPEARQGCHDDTVMARAIGEEGKDSMYNDLVIPFKRNPLHFSRKDEYISINENSSKQPWAM